MGSLPSSAADGSALGRRLGGYGVVKRTLDIMAALFGLAVLAPLILLIALAIKLDSPGPILFRQQRVGRGGRLFVINKFRTMAVDAAKGGSALTVGNDPRITRLGAFLRQHKLDELPQLLNVVFGDMSLVGPRPEVPELMPQYSAAIAASMLTIRPGVTDDASIMLRDESTLLASASDPIAFYREVIIPLKFAYHQRYLANICLTTDLRVIAATLSLLVVKRIPQALDRRRLLPPSGAQTS